MNISGILVQAKQERMAQVRTSIAAMAGVEVHAAGEDGKLVVTIEKHADQEIVDTFEALGKLSGVISTAMIYHHFEPESNYEEEA